MSTSQNEIKGWKNYLTDTLDTEGILRLIESVPSPKAEAFKLWLAQMVKERIDEVFHPEQAIKYIKGADKLLEESKNN